MNKGILILLVVILAGNVMALGITPGRTTFDYEPGALKEVGFKVVNSENKDINLVVIIQGELNQSVSVSEVSFKMASSEREKSLNYRLNMPEDLDPGLHTAEVVVIQLPEKTGAGDAFVGSSVGVATQIHVFVPYPGKYAEGDLNIVPGGSDVKFVVPVHNKGDLDLVKVRTSVDIYTALNEKVATVRSSDVSILSQQRKDVVASWDTTEANPGKYLAVVSVLYDEEIFTLEREFSVGEESLELQEIEVNNFRLGEIAKFEMLVHNKWSSPITGAYAQMLVYNADDEIMADFKSPTYDIPPLEKSLMVSFWDTAGVREGNYDASVFLRYGERSDQQDLKLEVSRDNINIIGVGYVISEDSRGVGGSLTVILVVIIAVLIMINVLWFLVLRKRLHKK